jgi:hypothetical protein
MRLCQAPLRPCCGPRPSGSVQSAHGRPAPPRAAPLPPNSSWTRTRALAKLHGLAISAVGWQRQPRPAGGGGEEEEEDLDNTTGCGRRGGRGASWRCRARLVGRAGGA